MIAQELEVSLHMAFVEARQKRHEFITVEHLLLALLDNPTAAEVLRACGAGMDELRKNLSQHISEQTPRIAADREVDTQPTLGFQRVIQRAILHVQSSGKKEVTGANVLVAIFGEKDSHAVYFLQQQDKFDAFVDRFNRERPHQGIDMKIPAELYRPSQRAYRGLPEIGYPLHDRTVTITTCGRICIGKLKVNVSQVFAGQAVGIKQVADRIWLVSFMHYDLGYIDLEQKTLQTIDNPFGTRLSPMS